jgi:DNA/RNA endonuclease G (NUC1)
MDFTSVHPSSANLAHLIDLHLWRGPPQNLDASRPVQILVNQGYVVGFCPARLQPAWSAYRVADAERDVDFARPIHYHDDLRLPEEHRIGRRTFGKLGNIGLQVGHMTPNEVINRQFGRLAQLETFLMSNMSPQYGALNGGVWLKLETAIREIKDEPDKDHVWAIVGPIYSDQPASIERGPGKHLPVPQSYFCITVDPFMYPYDRISNANIDCFIIPQDAPPASSPTDYPATLAQIEAATQLKFFTDWGRELPVAVQQQVDGERPQSRLRQVLAVQQAQMAEHMAPVPVAQPTAASIDGLIAELQGEAAALGALQRALSDHETGRLAMIQHSISWLLAARQLGSDATPPAAQANFITYKIVNDMDGRLKDAARIACNFWNRFIEPQMPIVIRLDLFTSASGVIARAYAPYENDGVRYGVVEFNTRFLAQFSAKDTSGTIIHEIGHTLGFGWAAWDELFDINNGLFKAGAVGQITALGAMVVELDGGPGTALSHWDEDRFDKELMTGFKDAGEFVLPVTIDVMALLGHQVIEPLVAATKLDQLLDEVANLVFSRQDAARQINVDYFEPTTLMETVPHTPV